MHVAIMILVGLALVTGMSTAMSISDKFERRCLLELLANNKEWYGIELVKASGGRLKRGRVYVALQALERDGFVESREEPGPVPSHIGIPRRLYRRRTASVLPSKPWPVSPSGDDE